MLRQLKLILLFILPASLIQAQKHKLIPDRHLEAGNFYYRNYSPKEYSASFQNWSVIQGKQGIMFFANGDGVLIYDGTVWELVETPTESVIRSIALDDTGKIYVGALDDMGYLDRGKDGGFTYVSLLQFLNPGQREMGNIWNTHAHNGKIYFEAETGMFCWNGERFTFSAWPNHQAFHKSFFWKDQLYLYEEGIGLMQFKDGKFMVAPGGEYFKTMRIYTAVALTENTLLLGTRHDAAFKYDGHHAEPFKTEADPYFKNEKIYSGIMMPDGLIVFGTRTGGVVVLDKNGKVMNMITKENGLSSNTVWGLTLDHAGDLWLSLDDGISRVEINTPITTYQNKKGFEGATNDLCKFNGNLYVATNLGLFLFHPASFPKQAYFEKISGINVAWGFLKTQNSLLVATNQGVFEIAGKTLRKLTENASSFIHQYKADSTRILIATDNRSLQSLRFQNGAWHEAGYIPEIKADNVKFNETHEGKVWIGTFSQGAYLLSFTQPDGSVNYDKPEIRHFDSSDGLEEGYIKLNTIDGEDVFRVGSEAKIFRFNHTTNRFYQDSLFSKRYGFGNDRIFPITNEDENGSFWAKTKRRDDGSQSNFILSRTSSTTFNVTPIDISRVVETVGLVTYPEENGTVWYAASGGVVRQEFKTPVRTVEFETYINKIILPGDSIFHRGTGNLGQHPEFPYSLNTFRFEFTSTNFVLGESNQFQYKLEGYDQDWSEWTKENIKEYSRIWEGDYKFLVRSRNYAGVVGKTDTFSFSVTPPWYRSVYAYAAYLMGIVVFVWGVVRWRSYQLRQEKEALKKEIAARTIEITTQNIQLEEQSEELRVNAEKLKELDTLKSNFFVNISHEFRTPLSLILSPLEKSLQEKDGGQFRLSEIERMHRNARRLQQLINQLLDLAKLESGGMKVNVQQADLIYVLRVLTASFESLAETRNIRYEVDIPANTYPALFDTDKIETVLYNLLSNAFKFTPDGGRIDFRVSLPVVEGEHISIAISDTGPGIPQNELSKIFDRFYQVDGSSSREYEGSGIGLSLVKELVQLMNGTIRVKSQIGAGATFIIYLPIDKVSSAEETISEDQSEPAASTVIDHADKGREKNSELLSNESTVSDSLILLIEDNADLRAYLKESLENDYQIAIAENGQLGWDKSLELIPDLIISDMMMPVMDGFTLCTKIRADERTSHIPFILLTARTSIENKLEGLELGADEYMTKPFNVKEIRVRVKNLLEQRKTLRRSFSRELTLQPKNIFVTSVDERFLNHALEIMEAHLSDDQFSVEKFAEEIGMSRKNLLRKIKAMTGESVNEFIRNYRLKRAAQLLNGKAGTVSEIAYQVGFNNLSYFSKCFKELFEVLPTEYAGEKSSVI